MCKSWFSSFCTDEQNAFFEAGHAVIAILEGFKVVRLSTEPVDDISCWIEFKEPNLSRQRLRSSHRAREEAKSIIRVLLAGPPAQARYSFGSCPTQFNLLNRFMLTEDVLWRAIAIAGKFSHDGPAIIRTLWAEVADLIQDSENWAGVDAVARTLLSSGELTGFEAYEIAHHAMGR